MLRSLMILLAAVAVTATATGGAEARSNKRFAIFDQQTGKKIFDDGKLDGRGCVVGKKAVFNQTTGKLSVVPAAKCNF